MINESFINFKDFKLPNGFSLELIPIIKSWGIIWKSPYSNSLYNKEKYRGETIDGTIRISDHWNYLGKDGKIHSETIEKCPNQSHYSIGKYNKNLDKWDILNSFYKIEDKALKEYDKEQSIKSEKELKTITDENELYVKYILSGEEQFDKIEKISVAGSKISLSNNGDKFNRWKNKMKNRKYYIKRYNDFEEIKLDMLKEQYKFGESYSGILPMLKYICDTFIYFKDKKHRTNISTLDNFFGGIKYLSYFTYDHVLSNIENTYKMGKERNEIYNLIEKTYNELKEIEMDSHLLDKEELEDLLLPIQDTINIKLDPFIIYTKFSGFHWGVVLNEINNDTLKEVNLLIEKINHIYSIDHYPISVELGKINNCLIYIKNNKYLISKSFLNS